MTGRLESNDSTSFKSGLTRTSSYKNPPDIPLVIGHDGTDFIVCQQRVCERNEVIGLLVPRTHPFLRTNKEFSVLRLGNILNIVVGQQCRVHGRRTKDMKPVTVVTAQSVGSAQPKHAFPILMQAIDLIGGQLPQQRKRFTEILSKRPAQAQAADNENKREKTILLFFMVPNRFFGCKNNKIYVYMPYFCVHFPLKFLRQTIFQSQPNDFSIS